MEVINVCKDEFKKENLHVKEQPCSKLLKVRDDRISFNLSQISDGSSHQSQSVYSTYQIIAAIKKRVGNRRRRRTENTCTTEKIQIGTGTRVRRNKSIILIYNLSIPSRHIRSSF